MRIYLLALIFALTGCGGGSHPPAPDKPVPPIITPVLPPPIITPVLPPPTVLPSPPGPVSPVPVASSKLLVVSSPTISAHPGVFYTQPVVVKVVDQDDRPIAGVVPTATASDNGWVISDEPKTSAAGTITYRWAPSSSLAPSLTITYAGSSQTLVGTTVPWATNPDGLAAILSSSHVAPATGYQRDVTPHTDPIGTYYASLSWSQGYAGLQVSWTSSDRQAVFSAWDVPGYAKTTVVDAANSTCRPFGGEGTGIQCRLDYAWTVGKIYRFTMTSVASTEGYTDLTVNVSDFSNTLKVGTLRQYGTPPLKTLGSFVEDDILNHSDCFSVPDRAATFGIPSYLLGTAWIQIPSSLYLNWDPTKYCATNTYRAEANGNITLYVGGSYQAKSVASSIYLR